MQNLDIHCSNSHCYNYLNLTLVYDTGVYNIFHVVMYVGSNGYNSVKTLVFCWDFFFVSTITSGNADIEKLVL